MTEATSCHDNEILSSDLLHSIESHFSLNLIISSLLADDIIDNNLSLTDPSSASKPPAINKYHSLAIFALALSVPVTSRLNEDTQNVTVQTSQ